jgi:hypothetical protein
MASMRFNEWENQTKPGLTVIRTRSSIAGTTFPKLLCNPHINHSDLSELKNNSAKLSRLILPSADRSTNSATRGSGRGQSVRGINKQSNVRLNSTTIDPIESPGSAQAYRRRTLLRLPCSADISAGQINELDKPRFCHNIDKQPATASVNDLRIRFAGAGTS